MLCQGKRFQGTQDSPLVNGIKVARHCASILTVAIVVGDGTSHSSLPGLFAVQTRAS
jgi:hypothetical protein